MQLHLGHRAVIGSTGLAVAVRVLTWATRSLGATLQLLQVQALDSAHPLVRPLKIRANEAAVPEQNRASVHNK
jgi:hypothetical protein